ncbi:MAG: hypothetical protein ACR2HA_13935 [Nocardioides sp.]
MPGALAAVLLALAVYGQFQIEVLVPRALAAACLALVVASGTAAAATVEPVSLP